MSKTPQKHYVDNKAFLAALVEYKEKCISAEKEGKEKPVISNYIGSCFIKIAEGLSHIYKFNQYTFKDEMISDGVENCMMYFHNFDPMKSNNPFGYFTQIIYFAFIRRIAKEKKQQYVKYKSTEKIGILDEMEMLENEDGTTRQFELYDNLSEFISKYEKSREESKQKKKLAKKNKGVDLFDENVV
jgi:hypothetical protein